MQPKAIAQPLAARLYHRGREILVRLPGATACRGARATPGSASGRSGWPPTHSSYTTTRDVTLGRVFRDVRRKLVSQPEVAEHFAGPLARSRAAAGAAADRPAQAPGRRRP